MINDDELRAAIKLVLEQYWEQEMEHYASERNEGPHIFEDLVTLRNYVDDLEMTPDDYLDDEEDE